MSPTKPAPKRPGSSREAYHPPRDRKELMKTIGAATAVVVLSIGAVLFLGRDYLGDDDTAPVTPVPTAPAGSGTAPTTPTTPATTPPSSAPAGENLTPPSS